MSTIITTSYSKVIIPVHIKSGGNGNPAYWYAKFVGQYYYVHLCYSPRNYVLQENGFKELFFSLCPEMYQGKSNAIRIEDCRVVAGECDFIVIIPIIENEPRTL